MPLQFKSKRLSFFSNLLLDFSLLSVAFLVVYYFKRRHIYVEKTILLYLPVYFVTWLGATLLTRKFRHYDQEDYLQRLRPYLMAILLQIGSMSILLFAFNWLDLSRFIVFGSVGLFFLMEMMFIAGAFFLPIVAKRKSFSGYSYSVTFFFLEFALISGIFLAIYFYKRGHLVLTDEYKSIFLVIFFSWMFISLFTHRFRIPEDRNYLKVLRPFIRSSLLTIGLVSFFVFTFRILEYSRLILFGSLGLFMVFEVMMVTIYYLYHKPQETDEPVPNIFSATLLEEPEPILEDTTVRLHEGKYRVPEEAEGGISIRRKLCNVYLRHLPEVYQFLDEVVDLESVDYMTAESIHASHPYNVEVLPDNTLHFFMNLHEINDIRRINRYFIEVNKKLRDGAIFVGRFEPYGKRRQRFLKNYS
ncbi:MAG TPA: hypothetical protein PLG66_02770, partial [Calditrichia bacterium]|nr:hypothetical protein [Calditrichia bacterium]